MATSLASGVGWGSSPTIYCAWQYDRRRNGANMEYRVYGQINTEGTQKHFGYPIYLQVKMDGSEKYSTTIKSADPAYWSTTYTFDTGWKSISNKTSGSTSLAIRLYSGSGSTRDSTYNYTMAVDPAGSSISASNGTLGTAQTITLTKQNSAFTDTVEWICGSESGTIATKTLNTSLSFTPALSLAAQNTEGTSVSITLKTTTYSGNTVIESKSITITCAIPASVKPSAAVAISEAATLPRNYGAYVQGKSRLRIQTTPSLAYNSPINSYAVTADGASYSAADVTTPVLQNTGSRSVSATVTDKRGRTSAAATASYTVLAYAQPYLTAFSASRCNQGGTIDPEGHYMRIAFTGKVTALNNLNTAVYVVRYRAVGTSNWTEETISAITGNYTGSATKIYTAADASAYEVQVLITDDFGQIVVGSAVIPVAFTIMHWRSQGDGMAIGGINNKAGLQVYMNSEFYGTVEHDVGGFAVWAEEVT